MTAPATLDCPPQGTVEILGTVAGSGVSSGLPTRAFPTSQLRVVTGPPKPMTGDWGPPPSSGLGVVGCRCVHLVVPDSVIDGFKGLPEPGTACRLDGAHGVWAVCSDGAIWAAIVTWEPFGVGPWRQLATLPLAQGLHYVGGTPVLEVENGLAQPVLATFPGNRVVVAWQGDTAYFEGFHPTIEVIPFDVVGDDFVQAGIRQSFDFPGTHFPAYMAIPQGPWAYGPFARLDATHAAMPVIFGPWGGVIWTDPSGADMALSVVGLPDSVFGRPPTRISSSLAADPDTGRHLYASVEATSAVVPASGIGSSAIFGYVVTTTPTGVEFSNRTLLAPTTLNQNRRVEVVRLGPGRFLIADDDTPVVQTGPTTFVGADGNLFGSFETFRIVDVDAGGMSAGPALPGLIDPWQLAVDPFSPAFLRPAHFQEVDARTVMARFTRDAIATMSVSDDAVKLLAGWDHPDGVGVLSDADAPEGPETFTAANPGFVLGFWNPFGSPPAPEARICLLSSFGGVSGDAGTAVRDTRLSPRTAT